MAAFDRSLQSSQCERLGACHRSDTSKPLPVCSVLSQLCFCLCCSSAHFSEAISFSFLFSFLFFNKWGLNTLLLSSCSSSVQAILAHVTCIMQHFNKLHIINEAVLCIARQLRNRRSLSSLCTDNCRMWTAAYWDDKNWGMGIDMQQMLPAVLKTKTIIHLNCNFWSIC